MNKVHRDQGFTLIEVMVVVVILGILAAILVPKVMDRPEQARITKARQDIRALEAALNLYKLDNFVYPSTDQGLEALVEKPSSPEPPNWKEGGYVDRLPMDPWKQPINTSARARTARSTSIRWDRTTRPVRMTSATGR